MQTAERRRAIEQLLRTSKEPVTSWPPPFR